jgi:Leucine-rich repeat (LRR) protein
MEQERGDDYLRRLASFIRANEKGLAAACLPRRPRNVRPASSSVNLFSSLAWLGTDSSNNSLSLHKPMTLSIDTHHLFYILMRLEASGYDIGNLDVHIEAPSRPMNYLNLYPEQHSSDTLSLASFRSSLSAASRISLGNWWNRSDPITLDDGLRYLYSSFTKLPALSICAPSKKVIAELLDDSPSQNAVPLDAFKNLQALQCEDIDPRTLLGWDRLAESLRSLRIKKSGLQDVSEIFLGAVLDDQARRQGSVSRKRQRNIPQSSITRASFPSTSLTNIEDEDNGVENITTSVPSFAPSSQLVGHKWTFLKHLYLSDNELTFFPSNLFPYLTSLTHLDLSSNLFVAIPSGLGTLHNLLSLSLADNLIDSVVGINLNLGQVLFLNLAHNRLESLCGLERLLAVEKVDIRDNLLEETAEVGRLATLPHIAEIWVEGNPFVETEAGYRVSCFDHFWKEGKTVLLDGTVPGFYEKRYLSLRPAEQMSSSRPPFAASSSHVIAVDHGYHHTSEITNVSGTSINSRFTPVDNAHRKRSKRIVNLDTSLPGHSRSHLHFQTKSEGSYNNQAYAALVLPEAATNQGNVSAVAHHNTSPPEYRHHTRRRSEHDSPAEHDSTQNAFSPTSGPLWDLDSHTSLAALDNCSVGLSQGSAILSSADIPRVNSIASRLGSGLPNDTNSDTYRKKIEGLKKDMGDSWLKIYSQG